MPLQTRQNAFFIALGIALGGAFGWHASVSEAAVLGHWRFEGDATGFLSNSAGSGRLLHLPGGAANPTQYTLPANPATAGGLFPNPVPHHGAANAKAARFDGGDRFGVTDEDAFTDTTFTAEAYINATSTASANKAIIGHWSSTGNQRSWLLALDSANRLAFLYSGTGTTGTSSTLTSSFTLSTNRDYYVGISVNMADTSANGIRFYLYDLAAGGPLQSQGIAHAGAVLMNPNVSLTIGATAQPSSEFSGVIDEVRLSDTVLTADQLLIPEPAALALLAAPLAMLLRRRR